MDIEVKVCELREGDLADLEGDKFADPGGKNIMLQCQLVEVMEIIHETADCIAIGFDGFDVVGFPPDHKIMINRMKS